MNKLRFLPPQPIEPWAGIKPATDFGSGCLNSLALIPDWFPGIDFDEVKGDEDCLFINVQTPKTKIYIQTVLPTDKEKHKNNILKINEL